MDNSDQFTQAMSILHVILPMIFMGVLIAAAIKIVPYWQIFKKAGFPPALSILMILPFINLIMLYVLGFSQWKVIPAPTQTYYPPPAYPPPPQQYTPPQS